jgi:phage terminase small subunit
MTQAEVGELTEDQKAAAAKLNDRQLAFANLVLTGAEHGMCNADCYRKAGYKPRSDKSAQDNAARMIGSDRVSAYLKVMREGVVSAAKIDAAWLLTRLGDMADADITDIIDEETGAYKRVHDWPLIWRRMLNASDMKEIFEFDHEQKRQEKIGEIIKYRFVDRMKALEMLGKHTNVQAFKERIETTGSVDMNMKSTLTQEQALALLTKNEVAS